MKKLIYVALCISMATAQAKTAYQKAASGKSKPTTSQSEQTYFPSSKPAADHKYGLGAILGEPTGISGKMYLNKINAIDLAVGWARGAEAFHLYADYLWHMPDMLDLKNGKAITVYYGIGGRMINWKHSQHHDGHSQLIGARAPVGLSYTFRDPAIELFGEVAMALNFSPETDVDLDAAIGARFYF